MNISLLGLAAAVTVIPVAAMLVFISAVGRDVENAANENYQKAASVVAEQTVADIMAMCDIVRRSDNAHSQSARNEFVEKIGSLGKVSVSANPVLRLTREQDAADSEIKKTKVRLLSIGDESVDFEYGKISDSKIMRLLQSLKKDNGCEFGILSYIPSERALVRAATTVRDIDSDISAGTLMSAKRSRSAASIISNLERGAEFSGIVDAGDFVLTATYIPLKDENGKLVGAIFFGHRRNSVAQLERWLKGLKIGESGGVWTIDDSCPKRPYIRIARDESAIGTVVGRDSIEPRRNFFKNALSSASSLKSGQVRSEKIALESEKGGDRIVSYGYYAPWGWIVGTICNPSEFVTTPADVESHRSKISGRIVLAGLVFIACGLAIAYLLSIIMTRPLKILTRISKAQTAGRLAQAGALSRKMAVHIRIEEFAKLSSAIINMSDSLSRAISEVRRKAILLSTRATEVTLIADKIGNVALEEEAATEKTAGAGRLVSASGESVCKASEDASKNVSKIIALCAEGGEKLSSLSQTYDAVFAAAETFGADLGKIVTDMDDISGIVLRINDAGIKTNILSLNASLEAEKAGEEGATFAVISRHIRNLGSTASELARETEKETVLLRESVEAGMSQMKTITEQMQKGSNSIVSAAPTLLKAMSTVENITPSFSEISVSVDSLSNSAETIREKLYDISATATRASKKIALFAEQTKFLESTGEKLLGEVARFDVDETYNKEGDA